MIWIAWSSNKKINNDISDIVLLYRAVGFNFLGNAIFSALFLI
jgi:hypothetical protein